RSQFDNLFPANSRQERGNPMLSVVIRRTVVVVALVVFITPLSAGTVTTAVTTFPGLQQAVSSLKGSPGVIEMKPGKYTVTSSYAIPSNVTLLVKPGAVFLVSAGTLLIQAHMQAGRQSVFHVTGTGNVSFCAGPVESVLPEWFYTGSGTWQAPINRALSS